MNDVCRAANGAVGLGVKLAVLILAGAWVLGSTAEEVRPNGDEESQGHNKAVVMGRGRCR